MCLVSKEGITSYSKPFSIAFRQIIEKFYQSLGIAPILKYNDNMTLAETKEAYAKGISII